MGAQVGWGVGLVVLGGFLNGSFAFPMKRMPAWRWENTWLLYSLFGMVIAPWMFAILTTPNLNDVCHRTSWPTLIKVLAFGFGWGVGSTLFGLGIRRVGMALGFAIILGITASVGSLLPLAVLHPAQLWTRQGYALMTGLFLVISGVSLCSIAGRLRERELAVQAEDAGRTAFGLGLVICLLSGIFSSMLNFSFVFGKELQQFSLAAGASPTMAANLIWALALSGGFVANLGYCGYLLGKNRSWSLFTARSVATVYCLGGIFMGLIWFSGIAVYGMGAAKLGTLGGIVGWPLFMAMIIITGNVWGAVTGEWASASRRSYVYSWAGIVILLLAIYVISLGGGT
jgi:L-rhamnose-H+ transport protein